MRKSPVIFTVLLLSVITARGQNDRAVSLYEDNYLITGPSLQNGSFDIKFQLSLELFPIHISEKWKLYFTYTQTAVWNAYEKSSPFRDILFNPGLYADKTFNRNNVVTISLQHRSNGRPYFGYPMETYEIEDYSREMNYVSFNWKHSFNDNRTDIQLTARAGLGGGVDRDPHHEHYTQDLFIYYLGYLDMKVRYQTEHCSTAVKITPVWNTSIANITGEFIYKIKRHWPSVFVQLHYGYDEAMCDCTQGSNPPCHLRIGLSINQ